MRQAYLDTIANREDIRQLQETADNAMGKIRSLHEQVVNRYEGYLSLRSRVGKAQRFAIWTPRTYGCRFG